MAFQWQDEKNEETLEEDAENINMNGEEMEPKRKKLRKSVQVEALEEFLRSLSNNESHYCRKRTSKKYLEPNWKSKRELILFYKNDWCVQKNVDSLSQCKFDEMFEDINLALFKPKKDACYKCESFKTGNLGEQDHEEGGWGGGLI